MKRSPILFLACMTVLLGITVGIFFQHLLLYDAKETLRSEIISYITEKENQVAITSIKLVIPYCPNSSIIRMTDECESLYNKKFNNWKDARGAYYNFIQKIYNYDLKIWAEEQINSSFDLSDKTIETYIRATTTWKQIEDLRETMNEFYVICGKIDQQKKKSNIPKIKAEFEKQKEKLITKIAKLEFKKTSIIKSSGEGADFDAF